MFELIGFEVYPGYSFKTNSQDVFTRFMVNLHK